ncbi:MAG: hypothetical protein E7376_01450 [Clostridiales bacterium]|nr:hypothetical protein [Clostridiales bacterium]
MDKTCCFIGHNRIKANFILKNSLKAFIEDLIVNKNITTFIFDGEGEFNYLCHEIVYELKQKYTYLTRVVYCCKYECAYLENEITEFKKDFLKYFNYDITKLGCEERFKEKTWTYGMAGSIRRNRAMIDNSNYCVFYYDKNYVPAKRLKIEECMPKDSTKQSISYAKKSKKPYCKLAEYILVFADI